MVRDGRDLVCSLEVRQGDASLDDRLERWIDDNSTRSSMALTVVAE